MHTSFKIFLAALLFATTTRAAYLDYPCAWTDTTTGEEYDLSALQNNMADYSTTFSSTYPNVTVWINVCRPVLSSVCVPCCGTDVAACMQWDPSSMDGQASMGNASSASWGPLGNSTGNVSGVVVTYYGGHSDRWFDIAFTCNKSAGVGSPRYLSGRVLEYYHFQWDSMHACPRARGTNTTSTDTPSDGHSLSKVGAALIGLFSGLTAGVAVTAAVGCFMYRRRAAYQQIK